ncbi:hypothetical protein EIN_153930 [Entamoeba invadens IP1]|uniref:Uncharacterized protein n=1 Tax=Entamoeba invadens IP1 TaxID=370355 RepID=A0A0A1UEV9_ENTIV|nr:hypothetical protein EIN_153930 [Entamoeba invadens IP1]ELP91356.1 hypothetical protein EIN_153930 [Entamoeba invadens IP1]|eukprot:XP_004258127.1 hypothetical protein EIN_153930 [Entamoeba invadens IP1]
MSSEQTFTPRYIVNKRNLQNYETMQHAILIGLLNSFCEFVVKKPRKQTIVRHCMPKLKLIRINGEELEVMKMADDHCRPMYDEECKRGMNKQTAFRRYEKNKKIFVINILYDIALELGFFFDAKLSRKTDKSLRIDRIQKVFYKGQYLMNITDLLQVGENINDYINSLLAKDNKAILGIGDKSIQGYFSRYDIGQKALSFNLC